MVRLGWNLGKLGKGRVHTWYGASPHPTWRSYSTNNRPGVAGSLALVEAALWGGGSSD